MYGAKSLRHVYLFEKGVIVCKRREDGAMSCIIAIMVSFLSSLTIPILNAIHSKYSYHVCGSCYPTLCCLAKPVHSMCA